jgi:hypothetical protein
VKKPNRKDKLAEEFKKAESNAAKQLSKKDKKLKWEEEEDEEDDDGADSGDGGE